MSVVAQAALNVALRAADQRDRLGFKGPRAAEWLVVQGITLPMVSNTWTTSTLVATDDMLLVARLGTSEFFLEDSVGGQTVRRISASLDSRPTGVYPVLREDWGFSIEGVAVHDVLAQVCNVNFADLSLQGNPLIMTLMIGVAVLVVPQDLSGGRQYRIWCDPTYRSYLLDELRAIVVECGGSYTGVFA